MSEVHDEEPPLIRKFNRYLDRYYKSEENQKTLLIGIKYGVQSSELFVDSIHFHKIFTEKKNKACMLFCHVFDGPHDGKTAPHAFVLIKGEVRSAAPSDD